MRNQVLLATAVGSTFASAALAQPAEQPPPSDSATSPSTPPDVVLLNDGGMLRGTIAEKTATEVTIVLMTGQPRTIPIGQVTYAGPESDRPIAAPPPTRPTQPASAPPPRPGPTEMAAPQQVRPFATIHAKESRLRLRSTQRGLTFHILYGSGTATGIGYSTSGHAATYASSIDAYSVLCTAPCEVSLPSGTHRLALSRGKHQPIEPDSAVVLEGDAVVHGRYVSRAGTRAAGLVTLLGSLAVGGYLVLTSQEDVKTCEPLASCTTRTETNNTKLAAGTIIGGAGTLTGFVMMLIPDDAEITVAPMSSSALRGSPTADRANAVADALVPSGAAFWGRF